MAHVTAKLHVGAVTARGACNLALEKFSAMLKIGTVRYNAWYRHGQCPSKIGKPTHIDPDKEDSLCCIVEMMRAMKIA
eukprot:3294540-Rhodomonas_salina.1